MGYDDPQKEREYQRKWREKNKEKLKKYYKRYNKKNKKEVAEYQKQYHKKHKIKIKQQQEIWHKNHPGKNKEYLNRFKDKMTRRAENREKPIYKREKIYKKYRGRCAYCGIKIGFKKDFQIDHLKPKSRGGTNDIDNLMPSCKRCNQLKYNSDIEEFRKKIISLRKRRSFQILLQYFPEIDEIVTIQNIKYHFEK